MSSKALKPILLIGGAIVLVAIVLTLLDIDVARWISCNGPFAPADDKASDVCQHLDDVP